MTGPGAERGAAVIPTGYDPGSYSCVRSLGRRGVETIIASEHENVPAAASRFCDRSVVIPSPHEDLIAYKDGLVELASQPRVTTILPLRPHDPYVFATYADEFKPYVTLVTPCLETLETVHDRIKLYEAARDIGVPVPETRLLSEATGWNGDRIVKSRYNLLTERYIGTLNSREAETIKQIEHRTGSGRLDFDMFREQMRHEPIVQEFVPASDEYVFAALYDHGDPLATFQHRQIRGDSYVGGGGVFRRSTDDPDLEAVGRTLLDGLDWHGLACIEYVKDERTGEFKLVEVNPRLWQSLPSAVHAGADFPYAYWLQVTGRTAEIDPEYDIGVGTHMLYGEFGYLLSLLTDTSPVHERPSFLSEAASVLGSCVETPYFDTLRFDDPIPFLRGIRHILSK